MLISAHYVESIIRHKRGVIGFNGNTRISLRGYFWDKNFLCPFTERKGAYIRRKDFNKIKIIDAYFLL